MNSFAFQEDLVKFLKERGKTLPYPLAMRLYYAKHFSYKHKYEYLQFEQARRQIGMPLLQELDLSKVKKSNTIFILGSGSSINKISPHKWQIISSHDSIGFNFWFCHKHIPTFYTFEPASYNYKIPECPKLETLMAKVFHEEVAKKEAEYSSVIKFITDLYPDRISFIKDLPDGFRQNLYAVPIVSAFARNELELDANIRYLLNTDVFHPSSQIDKLFKFRATLSALITFAIKLGYQRIVLCGIDLNNPAYFYQDPQQYPNMASFYSSPPGQIHDTLKPLPIMVPIDLIIYEMKRQILDPRGIEIYVENPSSALFPRISLAPDYLWIHH